MEVYLGEFEIAASSEDSASMGRLLSVGYRQDVAAALAHVDVDRACSTRLGGGVSKYAPLAAAHLKTKLAIHKGDPVAADRHESQVFSEFLKLFSASTTNWLALAPLRTLTIEAAELAAKADAAIESAGGAAVERQEALADALRKAFSHGNSHRERNPRLSKKVASLFVMNAAFKLYFKLNKLRLCSFLVNAAAVALMKPDPRGVAPFDNYPVGQRVTYKYYVGRLAVFEDDFKLADEHLTYALRHCHKDHYHNRRLILQILVPVRLQRGRIPKASLLTRYRLEQFQPLCDALRTGDVRLFTTTMEAQRNFFIHTGVYLLLERLETLVYRTLFKHIQSISGVAQLKLKVLEGPLRAVGVTVDLAELECILANLIFRGFVRGYISHSHSTVVVAKTGAFPAVRDVVDR